MQCVPAKAHLMRMGLLVCGQMENIFVKPDGLGFVDCLLSSLPHILVPDRSRQ